jgi:hypothetical protein
MGIPVLTRDRDSFFVGTDLPCTVRRSLHREVEARRSQERQTMGDELQAAGGSAARRPARALLKSYLFESGFYTPKMTPRGRLVAEVFDCVAEEFPSEYLEASGHLNPGVAVRLHDTCATLSTTVA